MSGQVAEWKEHERQLQDNAMKAAWIVVLAKEELREAMERLRHHRAYRGETEEDSGAPT
jgi:glycine cleavage system H lipoate-binding protein